MAKGGYVYIMASAKNGTLYTGVTSDLIQRVWQHKEECVESFTKRYKVHLLVWYEQHDTIQSAIYREKQIKNWPRLYKLNAINTMNPEWRDLYDEII
jgi:putative endonuclease